MNNIIKKFYVILGMLVLLTIPMLVLNSLVSDRQSYRNEAVEEIAESWAGMQSISAPSYTFSKLKSPDNELSLTLQDYSADVQINTEIRKRGIFKVPVYTADVKLKGSFKNDIGKLENKLGYFNVFVSDTKGFVTPPLLKFNNEKPRVMNSTSEGISLNSNKGDKITFEVNYKLRGLNALSVMAGGKNNNINVEGNWTSPSFAGSFLPVKREITKNGFAASWSVPKLAAADIVYPSCEVSLLTPVDNYRMVLRAVKYAFLFLSLIFMSFYIFEITSKRMIAPLQYLMVGAAMLIFYLLLVSSSEFIPFIAAYIISVLMTTGLISLYTYFVLTKKENTGFTGLITMILLVLYIFLYTLLRLEDFALITGSIGLFIAIAAAMYATRKIEWN